jgi:hypothetical protein
LLASDIAVFRLNAAGEAILFAGSMDEGGDHDAVGPSARFTGVAELALSSDGSTLFLADCDAGKVKKIDMATQRVTTLVVHTVSH